jgi:DNA-binding beta-propeller fold protein YncE/cytochrome c peroxidase
MIYLQKQRLWLAALLCLTVVLTACPAGDDGDNGGNGDNDNTPPTIGTLQLQNAADSNVTAAKIVVLQVTANDDKELAKVEFFQEGTKIGEDPTAPYEQSVSLTQANNGSLSFTAKAFDQGENESELSNAVSVTVNIQVNTLVRESKSSAIAITGNDKLVVQVNPENDSISTFDASTGNKLKEIPVGDEPVAVVIHPDDDTVFVLNRADGTIMKITDIDGNPDVDDELEVGSEPTGIALSPTGKLLVVTEFGESRVALIDTEAMNELDSVDIPNPRGVAITNDNDQDDDDEKVVITEFYGRLIDDAKEAKDDGRTGAVRIFNLNATNLDEADEVLFAPEPDANFAPTTITSPNQLYSVAIAGDKFFVTATAASPDGAASFNQNIRQLVLVGEVSTGTKLGVINLSAEIKAEVPDAQQNFMADIVDVSLVGDDILYFASRGGDGFQRAVLTSDSSVDLGFNAIKQVDLLVQQKCQNPIGVVTQHDNTDSKQAFVNCWVSRSMVTVDLGQQVAVKSTASANAPAAGLESQVNLGRRFYFTGRARWSNESWSSCGSCHPDGLADNITWRFGAGPRQTISMDGNFSHGPGEQIQRVLNWSGERDEIHDFERNTRGVSGGKGALSVAGTGTCGNFAGDSPPGEQRLNLNPNNENLPAGVTSDANGLFVQLGIPVKEIQDDNEADLCTVELGGEKDWDDITEFVKTIRPVIGKRFLDASSVADGRQVFEEGGCATCHSGEGWTISRVFFEPSSTRNAELAAEAFTAPGHTKLIEAEQTPAGPLEPAQIACVLRNVGTFGVNGNAAATDVLELKPPNAAGVQGRAQGEFSGFNVPSLFGLAASAPYLHHGQADTLEDLFTSPAYVSHLRAGNALFSPSDAEVDDLIDFLLSIDATTDAFDTPAGADLCAQFE